jgi:hypothetical protein
MVVAMQQRALSTEDHADHTTALRKPKRRCSSCGKTKPKTAFRTRELRKPKEERLCKTCADTTVDYAQHAMAESPAHASEPPAPPPPLAAAYGVQNLSALNDTFPPPPGSPHVAHSSPYADDVPPPPPDI